MSDDGREIVAKLIVEQSALQQYVDVLGALVDECKLHFDDDRLSARVVDPANVASIIPADLLASRCESYDAPGSAVVGASVNRLDELIGAANSGDLIHLRLDMATRKLLVDYREVHHEMALIDADSVRQEPDLPDLDLPNTVTVEAGDLSEGVGVVDLTSDHLELQTASTQDAIVLFGGGDVDESSYTIDDGVIMNGIREETSTLLSLEYLEELVKPMPDDAEVTVSYGDDFPIIMEWSACEGGIEVKQLLAPRIQSQ